jgi:hypothetical protein
MKKIRIRLEGDWAAGFYGTSPEVEGREGNSCNFLSDVADISSRIFFPSE